MQKLHKPLGILLALIMALGVFAIPLSSSAAAEEPEAAEAGPAIEAEPAPEAGEKPAEPEAKPETKPEIIDVTDAVPSESAARTLLFYMPEDWRSEKNPFYDGKKLSSCKAGIYWWEGSYNCSNLYGGAQGWPGYCVSETDKDDSNIFVAKIPEDVEAVVFNNLLKNDDDSRAFTSNVNVTGYYPDENDFYPEGLDSVDNMIFVPTKYITSELQPVEDGSWFYYYGGGKYGVYKTLAEAEKNGAVYSGGEFPAAERESIENFTVVGLKNKTYTGKAITQSIVLKKGKVTLAYGTDFDVEYTNNKNAGSAKVLIEGKGKYTGTIYTLFDIKKADNPMTVKAADKTAKLKDIKKKNVTVKNAVTVKKNQGAVSYKKAGGSKYLSVSNKGVITIKKGAAKKKTTLKIKISVTAKGNANYKELTKKVTVKITVK